ncbi:MAG TPA: hypothetical protein VNT20_06550 [Flavisolibacter sp.]|nr:hypothetical protein [Flavisolibacter sp.]
MKMFISFLIAAVSIGSALFAILFWLFKMEYSDALITSLSGALGAFVVDYAKERSKRKLKDIEA